MPRLDNPVRRLHELLKRGKTIDPNQRTDAVLSSLFQVDDEALFYRRLARFLELHRRAVSEAQRLNESGELEDHYLEWVEPMKVAFGRISPHATWNKFIDHVPGEAMHALRFCAERVGKLRPEPTVDDSLVQDLHAEIDALLQDVETGVVDEELRTLLARILRRTKAALDELSLAGIEPLQDALDLSVGAINNAKYVAGRDIVFNITQAGKAPTLGERLRKVYRAVATILKLGGVLTQLSHDPLAVLLEDRRSAAESGAREGTDEGAGTADDADADELTRT